MHGDVDFPWQLVVGWCALFALLCGDVNEKLFGVKASFDEEAYTTKLDRNAPDFKEKEKKAREEKKD